MNTWMPISKVVSQKPDFLVFEIKENEKVLYDLYRCTPYHLPHRIERFKENFFLPSLVGDGDFRRNKSLFISTSV